MFFLIPYIAYAIAALASISLAMSFFSSKNYFPVSSRTIIVTGGSQGLGLAVACNLASKGANVVIVAQDTGKLERALSSVQSSASNPSQQRFLQLSYDLRSPSSAPEILSEVTEWNNGYAPDIVWNCAGSSHPAFFADASIDILRGQFEIVYWSAAYMAHAALNLWKQPRGKSKGYDASNTSPKSLQPRHLIFTCSVLAFFPVAGYTPYTTAKTAMKGLADSLRQEVAVYNGAYSRNDAESPAAEMKVSIVYPMGILSPGLHHENSLKPELTKMLEEDDKPQDPDELAAIVIKKLEAGEHSITTLFLGHLMRGCGMGATPRTGVADVFWNWLGSIVVIFVSLEFISKCRKWGKEKGIRTGR
jgi:3-dehydrosphinganine reductase